MQNGDDMKKNNDLESFAKQIGLIKKGDNFKDHYRYWTIASKWKVETYLKIIPPKKKFKKLVDLGCGYGLILREISNAIKPKTAVGVDNSEITLKMAKKLNPDITFVNNDVCNLQFDNDSFDLAVLSDIIEPPKSERQKSLFDPAPSL